jgi:2-amino-4-hydroxy-6-hydroxymethyldihydropteridine diphosphokinase
MREEKRDRQALIAVGGNLPQRCGENIGMSPLETCMKAVETLRVLPGVCVQDVSFWYESAPVPPSGQPPYVNGVIKVATQLSPEELLAALHNIEATQGRLRSVPDAARTLDLDIIDMDGLIRSAPAPDPVLPHPRACQRAFVLLPLRDVAPDWKDPVSGRDLASLLVDVAGQEISRLDMLI